MTVHLSGSKVAEQITGNFPEAVSESSDQAVIVKSESLLEVAEHLK